MWAQSHYPPDAPSPPKLPPASLLKLFPTHSSRFLTRLILYVNRGDFAARERLKMSDQKNDQELDQVSGGVLTNPVPPILPPEKPPTHPIIPGAPIKGKTNPVG